MNPAHRLAPAIRLILIMCAAGLTPGTAASGQSNPGQLSSTPPWKRQLTGADAARVEKLGQQIARFRHEGRFADAIGPAREVAEIRARVQGGDHWQAADARRAVDDLRTIAALPEEGRQAMAKAVELENKATAAQEHAQYAESERLYRSLIEIRSRWLGEDHPHTADGYRGLVPALYARGKYTEAEPHCRKALAIHLKALGEDHPNTGESYSTFAATLDGQGRYAEAEPLSRKALAIALKMLGEDHPDAAACSYNLANNLNGLGRYAEAEPLHRKALALNLRARPEAPVTGSAYSSLGTNLYRQGRYAEAEPLFRRALSIHLKALGEGHRFTAISYANVAANLSRQGRYAEAEPLHRKALAIHLKVLGDSQRHTATAYFLLATTVHAQGSYAEAEPLFRKALEIKLKVQGEDNPETAAAYDGLALNLDAQARYGEAASLHGKALAAWLKALGDGHWQTAVGYNNLAGNLESQRKYAEALAYRRTAAAIYESTRGARGASGLARSLAPVPSPLPGLAIALARQGQPSEAWARWESDLARGLLDDLSARSLRPLEPEESRREAELSGQLQRVDERIARLTTKDRRSQDEDRQLDALRNEQSILRGRWVDLQNALDRRYQAYAGKPSSLEEVQKALAPDAALLGWLDVEKNHWACVVRHRGEPIWVRIPGSGPDGAWTRGDDERAGKWRGVLVGREPVWQASAEALARQRLAPLLPHLEGIQQLVVLPSQALAGVPVETLVSALPDGAPRPVISYAPSGSMFARLTASRSHPPAAPRLLAVGDPAFEGPARGGPAPEPPDHGLAVLAVVPNDTADLFGIKPSDVLLEYNRKELKGEADLVVVPLGDQGARVPIKLWRDGEVRALEISAGELGIRSSPDQPAAQIVLAQRAAAEVLRAGGRPGALAPLPGTRREVEAIASLFPQDKAMTLLGPDAAESRLQGLAQADALKGYRYIHLATHGEANPSVALNSAIFLAAEPDRPAGTADTVSPESASDGRITAEQIVRTWDLDAELVVLSACESGLGRYAGGEGYLGFAQALFVKGARSLVLSQWKVDDKATALLMARFYRNLLGKRPGLSGPMPKAEALHEAKRWLRNLTADEVGGELAALDRGGVRPLVKESGGAAPGGPPAPGPGGMRPYAHPYYWAAFLLIGDPD
jgi:tetratricopeptide (TPR) repeat protein